MKIAFAECVADLAKTAHRFLELAQLKANQDADETSGIMQYQVQGSYDSELTQLQQSIQSKIVHLLTDSVHTTKRRIILRAPNFEALKICIFINCERVNLYTVQSIIIQP